MGFPFSFPIQLIFFMKENVESKKKKKKKKKKTKKKKLK